MATFRFTAGPWNIHEGNETFGPGHRKSIPLEEKMKKYAEIGLAGMQFHDDDAVPDMNNMTEKQIIDYAKDVKAMLDKYGLFAEFVAPRLWFDKRTNDGGFTASRKEDREFAQWRARRSCDIAKALGQLMRQKAGGRPVVAIDGIEIGSGQFIDLGMPVLNGMAVPAIVKTLIFES